MLNIGKTVKTYILSYQNNCFNKKETFEMTITPWELYWLFKLDDIHTMLDIFTILVGSALGIFFVIRFDIIMASFDFNLQEETHEVRKKLYHIFNILLVILVISVVIKTFLPTTNQMVTLKVVPEIVNSEFIQKDFPEELKELYAIAKEYMKEQINQKQK